MCFDMLTCICLRSDGELFCDAHASNLYKGKKVDALSDVPPPMFSVFCLHSRRPHVDDCALQFIELGEFIVI